MVILPRCVVYSLFGLCAAFATIGFADEPPATPPTHVIEDVSVIDVIEGVIRPRMAIVVTGEQISAVVPMDQLTVPPGAVRIPAEGRFAIPGLWDMHIHWYGRDAMQLFPINGVTGVRLMWGSFMHHAWRRAFDQGEVLGPRMLIASALVDGPDPIWPGSLIASDAESGRKAVELAIKTNADFIKVYSVLPREAYFAIAEEAKRQNMPFDGHVPMMVSCAEASEAGQRCMEHLYEVILSCSREEDALRKMQTELVEAEGEVAALRHSQVQRDVRRRALASFDPERAKQLLATFRENGTWHCPTLTVLRNIAYLDDPKIQQNPNLKYMPPSLMSYLAPTKSRFENDQVRDYARSELERIYQLVADMQEADVQLLAGTDVLNPYCLPGFSLHEELQLMVKAGLTPLAALQAATINPAIFQGKEETLGSIDPGKAADIVLLSANPLDDISHTTAIEGVMLRGKWLDRETLDQLLAECEQAPSEQAPN